MFFSERELKARQILEGVTLRVVSGPARAVDAWYPIREDYRS